MDQMQFEMGDCKSCGTERATIDDHTTGDVVCTTCGWVANDERVYLRRPSMRGAPDAPMRRAQGIVYADSLLAKAGRAVAVDLDVDPTLLLIESIRGGVPADTRGAVDVALCRAAMRLCGDL